MHLILLDSNIKVFLTICLDFLAFFKSQLIRLVENERHFWHMNKLYSKLTS